MMCPMPLVGQIQHYMIKRGGKKKIIHFSWLVCCSVCLPLAELYAKYKVQVGTAVEESGHKVSFSPGCLSNQNQVRGTMCGWVAG